MQSLAVRQKKQQLYSEEENLYIIDKLLQGFSLMESNWIAHCDIKPQNIILTKISKSEKNGESCYFQYKIADFGISLDLSKEKVSMIPGELVKGCTEAYSPQEFLNNIYNPFETDV